MRRYKFFISILSITFVFSMFVSAYAVNSNDSKGNSNNTEITTQTQAEDQNQVQTQTQSKINMREKVSSDNVKNEIQAKMALKNTSIEKNSELKSMINNNIKEINTLRQTLKNKLVNMLQTLREYKNMTDLTNEQIADIEEKVEIVTQVRTILQEQNQQFRDSISKFRQDTSENKVDSLADIATAQGTRIDTLEATIALF